LAAPSSLRSDACRGVHLTEAGRFSEVVVAGETLGEASLAYLALRLLGYPMVRLWVPDDV
jgi:hypothetical protein